MFRLRPPVTALGMLLAGAALSAQTAPLPELPPSVLKTLGAQEASRIAAATAYANGTVLPTLSLNATDTLNFRNAITNTQGECVVRFEQFHDVKISDRTYHIMVQDTGLVVKVAPDGTCSMSATKVVPARVPLPTAVQGLTPVQALELMTAKLNPVAGFARTPVAEPVLFPASEKGDLALAKDPVTGLIAPDPLQGGELFSSQRPYLAAYRIQAELKAADPALPNARVIVILDAESGAILDRQVAGPEIKNPFLYARGAAYAGQPTVNAKAVLAAAAAQSPKSALPAAAGTVSWTPVDVPPGTPTQTLVSKLGKGLTQYLGEVTLPTTYDPVLNGYGLLDTTRGGTANYFTQEFLGYTDSYGYYHPNTLRPAGNMVLGGEGLGMWTPYTMDGLTGSMVGYTGVASDLVTGRPSSKAVNDFSNLLLDNLWGNFGNLTPDLSDKAHAYGAYTATGMTAAAEAMNTMTCAHEFLKYAFNRTGLDNHDSAVTTAVNFTGLGGALLHDTWWSASVDAATGLPVKVPIFLIRAGAGDPSNGILNAAEPTRLGQQIGAMLYEHQVGYPSSSSVRDYSAVAVSFTNLMSQGIYSLGSLHGINRRVILPSWGLGYNYANGAYAASMIKPSLDGISPDAYYDGEFFVGGGAGWYSSGPLNRAYFFMAEGASAASGSSAYSDYLPGGMTGIGLEKTCKIAYKALTERFATPSLSVFQLREALLNAAADLYGADGPEVQATANAFAAVNVGSAWGQPEPVRVWFDMANWPADTDLGPNGPFEPNPRSTRYPWVPMGETAQLKVNVSGTSNAAITWTNDPAPFHWSGYYDLQTMANGHITQDGLFTAPLRNAKTIGIYSVQATSQQDTRQRAQGLVFGLEYDYDGDGNNDALDLALLAMCVGVPPSLYDAINSNIMRGFPGISEGELQMNLAAFQTAFGN
ncbi:MAG TPA: M4 family metallopeptidase [Holophagaceae bacterium]|nr:M4 family metallopeptidase [Holophagaceae bacterium]